MAHFSCNTPNKHAMANALRALADMLDTDRATWRDFQLERSVGAGAHLRTTVSLTIDVFEWFNDPREHPAITAQPRLPDIQAAPSLPGVVSARLRIGSQIHLLTDEPNEGD